MRIGYFAHSPEFVPGSTPPERLEFLRQIGFEDVILVEQPIDRCDLISLVRAREMFEDFGLRLIAIENIAPQERMIQPIILGTSDRDGRVAEIQEAVVAMGRAGIRYYGLHWHVAANSPPGHGVVRTSVNTRGRGGALVTAFDVAKLPELATAAGGISEEVLWENFEGFLRDIIPVAESAGVTLGIHPHDPPLRGWGYPRIFTRLRDFQNAAQLASSSSWGLTFCLGNWQLMGEGELFKAINEFGSSRAINYVHVQAVRGSANQFTECFPEEGDCDLAEVIRALHAVGFDGTLVPAHMPDLAGRASDPNHERSTAYAVGYLKALLQSSAPAAPH